MLLGVCLYSEFLFDIFYVLGVRRTSFSRRVHRSVLLQSTPHRVPVTQNEATAAAAFDSADSRDAGSEVAERPATESPVESIAARRLVGPTLRGNSRRRPRTCLSCPSCPRAAVLFSPPAADVRHRAQADGPASAASVPAAADRHVAPRSTASAAVQLVAGRRDVTSGGRLTDDVTRAAAEQLVEPVLELLLYTRGQKRE